jgi:hypothetical protein
MTTTTTITAHQTTWFAADETLCALCNNWFEITAVTFVAHDEDGDTAEVCMQCAAANLPEERAVLFP